jgi:hypothetical protein
VLGKEGCVVKKEGDWTVETKEYQFDMGGGEEGKLIVKWEGSVKGKERRDKIINALLKLHEYETVLIEQAKVRRDEQEKKMNELDAELQMQKLLVKQLQTVEEKESVSKTNKTIQKAKKKKLAKKGK